MTLRRVVAGLSILSFSMAALFPVHAHSEERASYTSMAYIKSLVQAISRQVRYPIGAGGQTCKILVTQDKTGEVVSFKVMACDSMELQTAVESAVARASPLPLPEDPALFEPRLELIFIVPKDE